jgi:FlaA1/EpsC-like NDP-sugar epimerase
MVFFALENSLGGEIFVPKIPSYRITEVAKAIGPNCEHRIVGIRPGEKVHEEMITSSDSLNTIEAEKYFVLVPNLVESNFVEALNKFLIHYSAKPVTPGFRYSSGANDAWLSAEELRELIKKHVDPTFFA